MFILATIRSQYHGLQQLAEIIPSNFPDFGTVSILTIIPQKT